GRNAGTLAPRILEERQMNLDASENFELDEPAAKSYAPPGWPVQTIEITPRGKAPKKYGPTTYRFDAALTLSVILPRRGWTLVKKTKSFVYLIPPPEQPLPPFRISIAVPTPDECLALARRSHAKGQSWMGQLGEWPAWYLHERNTDMQEWHRDPETGEMLSRVHKNPPKSSLSIGEWGAWSIEVTGVAGAFAIGVLPPPLGPEPTPGDAAPPLPLTEGALKTVELTIYERNATARSLCIAHYGPTCQACGLNYEDKYGAIASDLIHVHHVTPLSAIGEAYQVDPIRDLIPLCATCHHVAHRREPPYSVAEIRAAIEGQAARGLGRAPTA
ncbi:HNH endonuclease, partial [Paludibacterium sp.]|uniref:HNH endonuclease n=1 Tax=Paludibacterium sp. TaxID=1917523 RepID=UPI0025ED8896